jgi:hypothetical protein
MKKKRSEEEKKLIKKSKEKSVQIVNLKAGCGSSRPSRPH